MSKPPGFDYGRRDVNALEPQHDFTPMLIAIYNGKYDFAGMLMEHGAKVNDGSLYIAIELRNMDSYSTGRIPGNGPHADGNRRHQMLLARGADPNQVFDKKPPQSNSGNVTVPPGATAFYRAVKAAI